MINCIPDCNFNPRSREGSDRSVLQTIRHPRISIHAPARGATGIWKDTSQCSGFQSTLPRGERQSCQCLKQYLIKFQSTLPRGERPAVAYLANSSALFQSTLPRGERLHLPESAVLLLPISIHAPARGATLCS